MMKKLLSSLLAVAMLALLAGCSTSGTAATDASSAAPSAATAAETTAASAETTETAAGYADTLVMDLVAEPVSMDPTHVTDINSMRVHDLVYDKLIEWDEDGFTLKPCLATEWTMLDEAGLEWEFQIRQGVKFHDGSDLNAEVVAYSFNRFLDESHPQYGTGPFPNASTFFGYIASVEATADYTVKFTLSEPCAAFLNYLTNDCGSIVSKKALEECGGETSLLDMGCGPYKMVSWEKGVSVQLEGFDEYWDGAPYTENVIIEPVVEPLVRVTKLLSGEADIIADIDPDSISQVEDSGYLVDQCVGPHFWYVVLNCSKAPFDNKLVRQAVNYAIDKDAIVNDILKGTGTVSTQPLSPVETGYNDELTGYPYDPEKARELLAEAGYADGLTINFLIPESGSGMQSCVAMSTAIQGYLADVGITANMEKMEWGTFLNTSINPSLEGDGAAYDMWSLSWMNTAGDPDSLLSKLFSADNMPYYNCGFYENQEMTDILNQAIAETDADARTAMYEQASTMIVDDAPVIFIDWGKQLTAHNPTLEGFNLHPSQMIHLEKVRKPE